MELGYLISIPTFVMLDNTLTSTEKLLYVLLCGYVNQQGFTTVSNETLAVHLRFKDNGVTKQLSNDFIAKAIDHLAEQGYIQLNASTGTRAIVVLFQKQAVNIKVAQKKPSQKMLGKSEDASKVLAYLSKACITRGYKKTEFKEVKSNLEHIVARLKEGHTYEECISVINIKFEDDYFKENPKYLSPQTLFRPSNFERYLLETSSIKDIADKVVTKYGLKNEVEATSQTSTPESEVEF